MKPHSSLLAGAILLASASLAPAATLMVLDKAVGTAIPDNDPGGLVSTISLAPASTTIESVTVSLDVGSGWNGDLYVYLEHAGVISVLLNRAGNTAGNPIGAGSSGLQVLFTDAAATDIHTGIPGALGLPAAGTFQPDARAADPGLVTDLSPRTLFLSGFAGQTSGGDWTLFAADVSDGDTAVLNNWSLSLTVVPEPSVFLLGVCGLGLLARRRFGTDVTPRQGP